MQLDDTIAALASPPGPAVRGIIRLCGAQVFAVVEPFFAADDQSAFPLRRSSRACRISGAWRLKDLGLSVPCELHLWPNSRSYTGQPTAELHLPGSPPVLEKVLEQLYGAGVRAARPGEFTLRAFLAGKLDLVQAEAVLGVIDAQSDEELRTALEQLAGGISLRLMDLRGDLLNLLADLEAGLDFVEEDIEFVSRQEVQRRIEAARSFVQALIQQSESRMTAHVLPAVVLAGLPNAGKSTLFNRLCGRDAALVSPEQGTTRDYLQAEVSANGCRFTLIDTAGWEDSPGEMEQVTQVQRQNQWERAALIVWCSAGDLPETQQIEDEQLFQRAGAVQIPIVRVWTKLDLQGRPVQAGGTDASSKHVLPEIRLSAHSGEGCPELSGEIVRRLETRDAGSGYWLGMTSARCRQSLIDAALALDQARDHAHSPSLSDEFLALELRESLDHLGAIVGAVYTDDLLDRIFSKFCIGK